LRRENTKGIKEKRGLKRKDNTKREGGYRIKEASFLCGLCRGPCDM
jgi:hypothetical protein